ncbi:MAG: hypothetical protein JWM86_2507 [Thermoleophilia bacterium]|nr:hypothetical protein [Thermoleophilia bacterium]
MSPISTAPTFAAGILPGGCVILPTRPVTPRPFDPTNPSGCWDPRTWGNVIQLPAPDAEIQAVEGTTLLG